MNTKNIDNKTKDGKEIIISNTIIITISNEL